PARMRARPVAVRESPSQNLERISGNPAGGQSGPGKDRRGGNRLGPPWEGPISSAMLQGDLNGVAARGVKDGPDALNGVEQREAVRTPDEFWTGDKRGGGQSAFVLDLVSPRGDRKQGREGAARAEGSAARFGRGLRGVLGW